ncbi:tail protein X [Trabulsiella odontotermitis]|uniref:tail protein X n=1 Tax=Trabulsiella odontotermitis TaxID=379893 RepID=UPI0006768677|nr:tail protein X [Trabulsiella odontotermitis]KNC89854.1 tail protein [Trabulsiella odontotermitis]
MKVKALQGDTVDLLCWRHYGATRGVTEAVLSANPGLSNVVFLEAGQEVELPELPRTTQRETVQLWG